MVDLGFLQVVVSYITPKPSGLWLYQRRYPADLRKHFGGKVLKKVSLQTKNEQEAIRRAAKLAAADDKLWAALRSTAGQDLGLTTPETRVAAKVLVSEWGLSEGAGHRTGPDAHRQISDVVDVLDDYFVSRYGKAYAEARAGQSIDGSPPESFYTPVEAEAIRLVMNDASQRPVLLSEAQSSYIQHKNKDSKFEQATKRYVAIMIDEFGDLPLANYTKQNVNTLRDKLLSGGASTATVKRYFKSLSAIFSHGVDEFDLKGVGNPFSRFKIPKDGDDARAREPFTTSELKAIQLACQARDDSVRHLVAIQSDTGARIAEIVGLRVEDVVLKHKVPHIHIRPHAGLGRSLKTKSSARLVPLVGLALWGAQRAMDGKPTTGWLFPLYAADNDIRSTSASNTVNKWLRESLRITKTSHSFRHSMADRLRAVDAPQGIIDAIGGWTSHSSMANAYGSGHVLENLQGWLDKVVIS